MSAPRRSRRERLAARAITGPAAFLVAGILDWVSLMSRYLWARARGRDPRL